MRAYQKKVDNRPEAIQMQEYQDKINGVKKKNTTGIPDNIKDGIEKLSGISLDDVTVHYNSPKPAEVGADAYAEGTDVYIGPGQEEHLPHELWHVIQQKQGKAKATKKVNGKNVDDRESMENEANTMGEKVGTDVKENNNSGKKSLGQKNGTAGIVQMKLSIENEGLEENPPGEEVLQRMVTVYNRKDLGHEDDAETFGDETIGLVKYERPNKMVYTKTDGDNTGSIKHYVPWNWIANNLKSLMEGKKRKDVYTELEAIRQYLGVAKPGGNPAASRAEFDSWVESVFEGICDWEENLFKHSVSSGDGRGTKLDTPDNVTALARVEIAKRKLEYLGLGGKPIA